MLLILLLVFLGIKWNIMFWNVFYHKYKSITTLKFKWNVQFWNCFYSHKYFSITLIIYIIFYHINIFQLLLQSIYIYILKLQWEYSNLKTLHAFDKDEYKVTTHLLGSFQGIIHHYSKKHVSMGWLVMEKRGLCSSWVKFFSSADSFWFYWFFSLSRFNL